MYTCIGKLTKFISYHQKLVRLVFQYTTSNLSVPQHDTNIFAFAFIFNSTFLLTPSSAKHNINIYHSLHDHNIELESIESLRNYISFLETYIGLIIFNLM